jgi:hypothetical protein
LGLTQLVPMPPAVGTALIAVAILIILLVVLRNLGCRRRLAPSRRRRLYGPVRLCRRGKGPELLHKPRNLDPYAGVSPLPTEAESPTREAGRARWRSIGRDADQAWSDRCCLKKSIVRDQASSAAWGS